MEISFDVDYGKDTSMCIHGIFVVGITCVIKKQKLTARAEIIKKISLYELIEADYDPDQETIYIRLDQAVAKLKIEAEKEALKKMKEKERDILITNFVYNFRKQNKI